MKKKETEEKLIENDKTIEDLEKEHKRDTRQKIILIIIIIILLLLFWFMCRRLGKIGFGDANSSTVIDGNIQNMVGNNTNIHVGNVIDVIEILDGDIDDLKSVKLDIFKNELFDGEKIIAPGSYGKYNFYVKNLTGQNITYDISFSDSMTNPVNMKYKIKIDNIYIRGSKDKFVTIDDINIDDVIVVKDSINMFTIEWYWEHNDVMDTYIGTRKEEQTYTLNVNVNSSLYTKEEND